MVDLNVPNMISNRLLLLINFIALFYFNGNAMPQSDERIDRIEPPHWWVGMENTSLQLMVYGKDIGNSNVRIEGSGVVLKEVHRAQSANYVFLDLDLSEAQPGNCIIQFTFPDGESQAVEYNLYARKLPKDRFKGFTPDDVIYLITPDRFANGKSSNDRIAGMKDQSLDRSMPYARHGGDIAGILGQLDYIQDMGFTAIWPSPLLENNMKESSYHGYAITDFYAVDPRFGTMQEYIDLAQTCRTKGIKLIMDMVANHCGVHHWWMQDLPFTDWISHSKTQRITNHRRTTNMDPYAAISDHELMTQGWFVKQMPDLNSNNPFMANYIIQNSIWWIELLQLGGVRQDTYPYSPKAFMSRWAGRIMQEYPAFNIVGEEWSYNPLLISYWQDNPNTLDGYRSHLKSVMDFPLHENIIEGLKNEEQWDRGLIQIYEALANDFIYPNPNQLMLFADNHDMDRIYTQLNQDEALTKIALGLVLTLPRIPQVYYGTEVLLDNSQNLGHDGYRRVDMPGGWPNDQSSAFSGEGLNDQQADFQLWLRQLLHNRKQQPAMREGKMMHFAPEDGVYVYFRFTDQDILMFVINKNNKTKKLDLNRFSQMLGQTKSIQNLSSNLEVQISSGLELSEKSFSYFKIK